MVNITFLKSPHFNIGRKGYIPIATVIHIDRAALQTRSKILFCQLNTFRG